MDSARVLGWALFDRIVATAPRRNVNPWVQSGPDLSFQPDYDTLKLLLGVPLHLDASSQSGVPALAFDVWISYEMRRAGFDKDRVWPRPTPPRVLPHEILQFLGKLKKTQRETLWERIEREGIGGSASANLLGKNYVKQVDVVMSSWDTGPELLISTKRMDSSFGKNAANRIEESYGDAKNLRLRYPQAAVGFVYGLSSVALQSEKAKALWLIDLLGKLGREDDAYHAVALVVPILKPKSVENDETTDGEAPIDSGLDETLPMGTAAESPVLADFADSVFPKLPTVDLERSVVPPNLDPGRFFGLMCSRLLDNTPINFHEEARRRRDQPGG